MSKQSKPLSGTRMARQTSDSFRSYSGKPSWPPAQPYPDSPVIGPSKGREVISQANEEVIRNPPYPSPVRRGTKGILRRETTAKAHASALRHRTSNASMHSLNIDNQSEVSQDSPRSRTMSSSSGQRNHVLKPKTRDTVQRIGELRQNKTRGSLNRHNTSSSQASHIADRMSIAAGSVGARAAELRMNGTPLPVVPGQGSSSGFGLDAISRTSSINQSGSRHGSDDKKRNKGSRNSSSEAAATYFEELKSSLRLSDILEAISNLRECCKVGKDSTVLSGLHRIRDQVADADNKSYTNQRIFDILTNYLTRDPVYEEAPCKGRNVLVIGCGPVGLRLAIELRALGANVHLLEKREEFTRTNILHLWKWVVQDVGTDLGGKFWEHSFGSGSTFVHAATDMLQRILAKTALLLGVEMHPGYSFDGLDENYCEMIEPPLQLGSSHFFDSIIDCSGASPALKFDRKSTSTSRAIGLVVQFQRHSSDEVNPVEEFTISKQFKQALFEDLEAKGFSLENCVYYVGDVHYFCFTPTKQCLLDNKVLKRDIKDLPSPELLLSKDNISSKHLDSFAKKFASYCGLSKECKFVKRNHAVLFDFSKLSRAVAGAAVVSIGKGAKVTKHRGKPRVVALCGDALLEPFWPEGLGVIRGNLIALDTAWMLSKMNRTFSNYQSVLDERMKYFKAVRELSSFTQSNVLKLNCSEYRLEPSTRYISSHISRPSNHVENNPPLINSPPHRDSHKRSRSRSRKSRHNPRKSEYISDDESTDDADDDDSDSGDVAVAVPVPVAIPVAVPSSRKHRKHKRTSSTISDASVRGARANDGDDKSTRSVEEFISRKSLARREDGLQLGLDLELDTPSFANARAQRQMKVRDVETQKALMEQILIKSGFSDNPLREDNVYTLIQQSSENSNVHNSSTRKSRKHSKKGRDKSRGHSKSRESGDERNRSSVRSKHRNHKHDMESDRESAGAERTNDRRTKRRSRHSDHDTNGESGDDRSSERRSKHRSRKSGRTRGSHHSDTASRKSKNSATKSSKSKHHRSRSQDTARLSRKHKKERSHHGGSKIESRRKSASSRDAHAESRRRDRIAKGESDDISDAYDTDEEGDDESGGNSEIEYTNESTTERTPRTNRKASSSSTPRLTGHSTTPRRFHKQSGGSKSKASRAKETDAQDSSPALDGLYAANVNNNLVSVTVPVSNRQTSFAPYSSNDPDSISERSPQHTLDAILSQKLFIGDDEGSSDSSASALTVGTQVSMHLSGINDLEALTSDEEVAQVEPKAPRAKRRGLFGRW